jgi:hypothetical protein
VAGWKRVRAAWNAPPESEAMRNGKSRSVADGPQNSTAVIPPSNSIAHQTEDLGSHLRLHSSFSPTKVWPATPARRRGPCLARRTGQSGTVVQHSKTWDPTAPCYGKFWVDVPGNPSRKRQTVALGICKTKSSARQRLREYLDREGVNSKEVFHQNIAPAITFRQQADS